MQKNSEFHGPFNSDHMLGAVDDTPCCFSTFVSDWTNWDRLAIAICNRMDVISLTSFMLSRSP
jgi:hypothetical protein